MRSFQVSPYFLPLLTAGFFVLFVRTGAAMTCYDLVSPADSLLVADSNYSAYGLPTWTTEIDGVRHEVIAPQDSSYYLNGRLGAPDVTTLDHYTSLISYWLGLDLISPLTFTHSRDQLVLAREKGRAVTPDELSSLENGELHLRFAQIALLDYALGHTDRMRTDEQEIQARGPYRVELIDGVLVAVESGRAFNEEAPLEAPEGLQEMARMVREDSPQFVEAFDVATRQPILGQATLPMVLDGPGVRYLDRFLSTTRLSSEAIEATLTRFENLQVLLGLREP